MKRLYVALALIILSVFICVFSSKTIEKNSSQMRDELENIGSLISDGKTEQAKASLKKTEKTWEKSERLFSFIVDADKIEEMNIGFSMIIAHLKDGNNEHALERLRECVLLLGEITENERLSVKNIM